MILCFIQHKIYLLSWHSQCSTIGWNMNKYLVLSC